MAEKKTFVTLEQLKEIDKTYPTPYHLYDEKGIRENAKKLKEAFSWNKGFKEYFAVKATPNPFLMQIFQKSKRKWKNWCNVRKNWCASLFQRPMLLNSLRSMDKLTRMN